MLTMQWVWRRGNIQSCKDCAWQEGLSSEQPKWWWPTVTPSPTHILIATTYCLLPMPFATSLPDLCGTAELSPKRSVLAPSTSPHLLISSEIQSVFISMRQVLLSQRARCHIQSDTAMRGKDVEKRARGPCSLPSKKSEILLRGHQSVIRSRKNEGIWPVPI